MFHMHLHELIEPGTSSMFYEHARFFPPFFWCIHAPVTAFPES